MANRYSPDSTLYLASRCAERAASLKKVDDRLRADLINGRVAHLAAELAQ